MIDQITEGVLESAGQQLLVEVDGQKLESLVNGLEPRHHPASPCDLNGCERISR